MADPKTNSHKSLYARLSGRFAQLALGASEDEDEDKDKKDARAEEEERDRKAREEGAAEEDENDKNCSEDERSARKERNAKRRSKARSDDGGDDEEDSPDAKAAAGRGRVREQQRWAAVLSSREAAGRVPLACSLLADTNMSPDRICAALLASPTESRQGLAARMSTVPRADLGSPPAARPDLSGPAGQASAIVSAYNKAIGRDPAAR